MGAKNKPKSAPAVTQGNVFATFVHEAQQIGQEVVARRAFDDDVSEFLKEKGLVEEFEAWRSDDGKRPV